DPDPVGPEDQGSGQVAAVGDPAGGDHRDPIPHRVDDLGDEGEGRHQPGVAPGLRSLRHDDVAARLDGGNGMPDLAAHVHHEDAVVVTDVDHVTGHTQPGH